MRYAPRIHTQRGLGPEEGELTDADILETDGVAPRSSIACPAPASQRPSMRYSYVAPRRDTASMLAAPIAGPAPRHKTLRPSAPDGVDDGSAPNSCLPFSVPPESGRRRAS